MSEKFVSAKPMMVGQRTLFRLDCFANVVHFDAFNLHLQSLAAHIDSRSLRSVCIKLQ